MLTIQVPAGVLTLMSSFISEANERPAVLLLTLEPDSVFYETDRLLGMAVTILESVVVVVLLLLLSSFLAQAANIIAMLIIII